MAPLDYYYDYPNWPPNYYPSPQDIINVRNKPLDMPSSCNKAKTTPNDYMGDNYNPAQLNPNKQQPYMTYQAPDMFNGYDYNA